MISLPIWSLENFPNLILPITRKSKYIAFGKLIGFTVYSPFILQAHTDVLVGVKAELGSPAPDRPKEGKLEFFVDWWVKFRQGVIAMHKHWVFGTMTLRCFCKIFCIGTRPTQVVTSQVWQVGPKVR